jgi:TonB-linked outer membrane protein, SusC/RagA family
MRLTAFVVLCFSFFITMLIPPSGHAQGRGELLIDVNFKQTSLKTILKDIERKANVIVMYESTDLRMNDKVDISLKRKPLAAVLDTLLGKQNLKWTLRNNTVRIEDASYKNQSSGSLFSMPALIPVSGIIYDPEGQPLGGVTIIVKSTGKGTISGPDGRFELELAQGEELLISSIGCADQKVVIQNGNTVKIRMVRTISKLDEIQVMGYGSTTRRLGTGTISSVKTEEIDKQPVGNVISAIDGRMSGVQVVQPNGLPGAGLMVQVRGDNTLGPNFGFSASDPLYVIDGIPQITAYRSYDTRLTIGVYGMNGASNLLSNLNPKDILQIDVLKDADATAIYGARGANGVVLITTKKGQPGRIRFNVDLNTGVGSIERFIPLLNTAQYLDLRKEAFANEGITPDANNAPDLVSWSANVDNDFQRMIFGGKAKQSNANISISGGNDFVRYYAGLNYRKEGTVMPGYNAVKRIGGLLNLDITSTNRKFDVQFSVNYSNEQSDIPSVNFQSMLFMPPNYEPVNPDGSYNWNPNFNNPLASLKARYEAENMLLNTAVTLSYRPLNRLTLKLLSSYSLHRSDNSTQNPAESFNPFYGPQVAYTTFAYSPTTSYTIEPQAVYRFRTGAGEFTALAGGTVSSALSKSTILYGSDYAYGSLLNTISSAGTVFASDLYNKYNYASGFARITYNLNRKYLLNLNYRKDASSRFGPNHKLAGFASVGAAWIFSSEAGIMKSLPVLSFGKLKVSYGTTGNDRVDNYLYEMYYNTYNGSYFSPGYEGINTLGPGISANPALAWEITRKAELSLDLGFLKDRILLHGNIYRNRSSNIINAELLSGQAGTTFVTTNFDAVVQNKGLELELTTRNIQTRDVSWTTSLNISLTKNTLIRFNNIENADASSRYIVGAPVNVYLDYYKYSYAGPDPVTGVPGFKNLDDVPGADRYVVGIGTPYYGGLNNTITFRNFTLDVFIKFQNRRGKQNDLLTRVPFGGMSNQNISALSRYRPGKDNEDVVWPLAVSGVGPLTSVYSNFYNSDFAYGNIPYLKIKNVNLSYDIPARLINKAGMNSVKIYLQSQNLFTLAKQKYVMDPEMPGAYPSLRTFVFGINCSL